MSDLSLQAKGIAGCSTSSPFIISKDDDNYKPTVLAEKKHSRSLGTCRASSGGITDSGNSLNGTNGNRPAKVSVDNWSSPVNMDGSRLTVTNSAESGQTSNLSNVMCQSSMKGAFADRSLPTVSRPQRVVACVTPMRYCSSFSFLVSGSSS